MTDGCLGSSAPTECSSVMNGLFSKGLHAATQYYIGTVKDVLNSVLHGSGATESLQASSSLVASSCAMNCAFRISY